MRYLIKFLFILLLPAFIATAQQKPVNLKIGNQVPPILIAKVINDHKRSFNTSEFKDRLLILDFWATTCSGCIEGLPKMLALQQQFGNKIKILPVTNEAESIITDFMVRNKLVKGLSIPSAVEDKILSRWFRFKGQPHEVWIYKGKVVAITSGEYVDARNIQAILTGKNPDLPVKDDFYHYDPDQPFLMASATRSPISYVAVTGYREGAGFRKPLTQKKDTLSGLFRTSFVNYPVLGAYHMLWSRLKKINYVTSPAVGSTGGISPNQVILEVKDKDKYIFDREKDYFESWHRKYDISYEWLASDTITDLKARNALIISDLDRLLGLNCRWEKRQTKCLALVRTDTVDRLKSKSLGEEGVFDYKTPVKRLHNHTLSSLVFYLNNFQENPPVFDETGYKVEVDINLDFNLWTDIPAIRKALQAYGLDLKEETRELDMFVLTETHFKK